jgi:hypothetical protein
MRPADAQNFIDDNGDGLPQIFLTDIAPLNVCQIAVFFVVVASDYSEVGKAGLSRRFRPAPSTSPHLVIFPSLLGTNSHLIRLSPYKNEEFSLCTNHAEIGIMKK